MVILSVLVLGSIIIFLSFVFLYLTKSKGKTFVKEKIKNKARIKSLMLPRCLIFYNKNSNVFNLYKVLTGGLFVLNKSFQEEYLKEYKKSGLDVFLPSYKYQFYNEDDFSLYNFLKTAKGLDKMGFCFNLLLFFNSTKNLKVLKAFVKHFNFKTVKVRLYDSTQIDYKLLGAINYFDLNKTNQNLNTKTNLKSKTSIFDSSLWKDQMYPFFKSKQGLFFVDNKDQFFEVENYTYANYYQTSLIQNKNFNIDVSKTFNYKNSLTFYKVLCKNCSNTMQTLKMCFGTLLNGVMGKNTIYNLTKNTNQTQISVLNFNKNHLTLLGNKFECYAYKNYFYVSKKLKLKAQEQTTFYFAVGSETPLNLVLSQEEITKNFEQNYKIYNQIKTPKVLTQNKILNHLINEFLPQKIMQNAIEKSELTSDLKNLISQTFLPGFIDKSFVIKNLNKYFLSSTNLFKIYFNLFYFCFGIWQTNTGIYVNNNKEFIVSKASVCLMRENKTSCLTLNNTNKNGEIEFNNVVFSNLNFLSFDNNSFKKNALINF